MKLTKEEIERKSFCIVNEGLSIMAPAHYNHFETVTEERAVMIEERIYCTKSWYDDLMKRIGK